jgi:antitoxin YefM
MVLERLSVVRGLLWCHTLPTSGILAERDEQAEVPADLAPRPPGRCVMPGLTRLTRLTRQIRMETASESLGKLAILMAMSVSEQMPLADVKNRLSEVVDRLEREHGRVVITKHGHPAAVVISVEDLESLEETLDVMGSAALLDDIREALAELGTADAQVLSKDDALRLIADR